MIQDKRIAFYQYILLTFVIVFSFAVVRTTIAQEVY